MVEIDPIVPVLAEKYFDLPSNVTVVIADALEYTSGALHTKQQFDYIVHDVFTGGAEPANLFTVEFLTTLRSLLKPDGSIAIVCDINQEFHERKADNLFRTMAVT